VNELARYLVIYKLRDKNGWNLWETEAEYLDHVLEKVRGKPGFEIALIVKEGETYWMGRESEK
jgi:biotin synthase-related radical SAM superfamily protein